MFRRRRDISSPVNAGSMADIAFLLLIFFLLTSSMDRNYAYTRQAPPADEKNDTPPPNPRNVLTFSINSIGDLTADGKPLNFSKVEQEVKDFMTLPARAEKQIQDINNYGKYPVSMGVIVIKTDDKTRYETYIRLNDLINKAFAALRNQTAQQIYNTNYANLSPAKQVVINQCIPQNISE